MDDNNLKAVGRELKTQAMILGGFVLIIWVLEFIDVIFLRNSLNQFGIRPRNIIGLRGILFAPFLHGGFYHVAANTIPFITLGWFTMLRGVGEFFFVSVVSAIASGMGTWLIGSPYSVHIGASGMIFGYLGFLMSHGFFERSFVSIFLSAIACFLYGGLVWGVLPGQYGISWEGHLFGFLGGMLAAWLMAKGKQSA